MRAIDTQIRCPRIAAFGVLYSWGCGESGQLGHASDDDVWLPKVVEGILGSVVGQVACGEHHTAVLSCTRESSNVLRAELNPGVVCSESLDQSEFGSRRVPGRGESGVREEAGAREQTRPRQEGSARRREGNELVAQRAE